MSENPYELADKTVETPIDGGPVVDLLKNLKLPLDFSLPYRLEKMFPKTEGFGAKGQVKRQAKLIREVEPRLRDFLLEGEEVWYIAKGIQHSIIEAMTIGALWSNMINQTVFVLTNARIVMMHSDTKGKTSEPCWMLYYNEISTFKARFTGVVKLKLKDKKNITFSGFPKGDRKSMPAIFEEAMEGYRAKGFAPECSQSREDACGHCFTVIPKGTYECRKCHATFWKASEIATRSLIFPAWGDFIMKHNLLALVEILGYLFSWVIAAGAFARGDIIFGVIILAFAHGFDALVTLLIAKKGLHTRTGPK